MEAPGRIGYTLVLVLVFSLCNQVLSEKVHASVMNRLGNGKNMALHCQSKDDDLGQQNIADGSEFSWDFSVNVGGTTLFYCDMGSENVHQYHFDAYSFGRDYARCASQCSWVISTEGVYGLNGQTGFWEFMYYWSN